jgi:hypothetical protein
VDCSRNNILSGDSGAYGRDWLCGRKDHCTREVLSEFFHLVGWFQKLYGGYLRARGLDKFGEDSLPGRHEQQAQVELLEQFSAMVGTEKNNGPLWQLKDLCHLVWPQEARQRQLQGGLIDWLVGSLFHEAMKLKENLYLLNNYGTAAVAVDGLADYNVSRYRQSPAIIRMVDMVALVARITGNVARQMERMGYLFGQVKYLFRMMLPDLVENKLILRLLAEQEGVVSELWGESLDALFYDIFAGAPADGFCLAGASYLQGQWYRQSLEMYQRALACDRHCDEAIVRLAHLGAILRDEPGLPNGK